MTLRQECAGCGHAPHQAGTFCGAMTTITHTACLCLGRWLHEDAMRAVAELAVDDEFAVRLRIGESDKISALVEQYLVDRGVSAEVVKLVALAFIAGALRATEAFGRRLDATMQHRTGGSA